MATTLRPRRRRGRVLAASLTLLPAMALMGACAPAAPDLDQVRNPSRSEVIDHSYGASWTPYRQDLLYVEGGSTGCGIGASTHEPCGGSQTLDVYPHDPSGPAARGTILYIHGGGFRSGDKSDRTMVGPMFHQRHRGWDVVSVDYRLSGAGGVQWPGAAQDVAAAVNWLRANGAAVGLETSRIVTFGYSAGGTLAALAGVAWNADDGAYASTTRVDGWVEMAGITDLATDRSYWLGEWGGHWLPAIWGAAARMSPTTYVDSADPPGYIIHGDSDSIVSFTNADRLKRVANQRGATVELDVVDRFADGGWMGLSTRNHIAAGGANMTALNAYLDRI